MKTKLYPFILSFLFLFSFNLAYAQQGTGASGGDLNGANGSISYTIGQVVYTTVSDNNNSLAQGIQQPYEISIISSTTDELAEYLHLQISSAPNPTTEKIVLNIDGWRGEQLKFQLFDIQGRLLRSNPIASSATEIQMNDLPASTYVLSISNKQNIIKSFKISKQ